MTKMTGPDYRAMRNLISTHRHTHTHTHTHTGTGTRTGSGRAEERGRSAKERTRAVDSIWETGETWVERDKKRRQELVQ